jgi:hypothetical protein
MRRSLKVLAGIVIVVAVLLAMQISVVAFPHPWFERSVRDGRLTIYTDDVAGPELETVVRGVRERIQAAEIYDESVDLRVFVCNSQRLYNLFARLSRVPTHVPGFNLSLFNNSFVSVPLLERRQHTNRAGVKHSVLAGELDEAIAHELIHDFTQEKIGFFAYRQLPRWKSEGYAEYAANRAPLNRDAERSLADRVSLMKTGLSDPRARAYYRWNLVVEFLAEVRGYTFADINDPAVTLDDATTQMMAWYEGQP